MTASASRLCVTEPTTGAPVRVYFMLDQETVIALAARVVRVTEDRQPGFCRADALRVLEPSPERVERPCPHSGPGRCGG